MDLHAFLKSNRQWPRHLRIANAQMQERKADTASEKEFWRKVIEANGTIVSDYRWVRRMK